MKVVMMIVMLMAATVTDEPVTLTGEVVDLHCYTTRGAKGEGHAGCANACISRDVPAGFLADDGKVYLILNDKMSSVKEKVTGKAGKKSTAKGFIVERDGMRTLRLVSLE